MGIETLEKQVRKNVFSSENIFSFYVAVKRGEDFTLTDFDSQESAKESASLILDNIENLLGKKYKHSIKAIGKDNYEVNFELSKE